MGNLVLYQVIILTHKYTISFSSLVCLICTDNVKRYSVLVTHGWNIVHSSQNICQFNLQNSRINLRDVILLFYLHHPFEPAHKRLCSHRCTLQLHSFKQKNRRKVYSSFKRAYLGKINIHIAITCLGISHLNGWWSIFNMFGCEPEKLSRTLELIAYL